MKPFGRIAYETYAEEAEPYSLIGLTSLPAWDDLSPDLQAAWESAAQAVLNAGR